MAIKVELTAAYTDGSFLCHDFPLIGTAVGSNSDRAGHYLVTIQLAVPKSMTSEVLEGLNSGIVCMSVEGMKTVLERAA